MSEDMMPKRWSIGNYDGYMVEYDGGDYVEAEDVEPLLAEIERLRARVEELSDLVGYLAGRNNDHIRVMLAGNPDVCDRLIDRARAALEAKP